MFTRRTRLLPRGTWTLQAPPTNTGIMGTLPLAMRLAQDFNNEGAGDIGPVLSIGVYGVYYDPAKSVWDPWLFPGSLSTHSPWACDDRVTASEA